MPYRNIGQTSEEQAAFVRDVASLGIDEGGARWLTSAAWAAQNSGRRNWSREQRDQNLVERFGDGEAAAIHKDANEFWDHAPERWRHVWRNLTGFDPDAKRWLALTWRTRKGRGA